MTQQVGILALHAGHLLPIQVLESHQGFFLGTQHPEEGQVSRESEEYWRQKKEAAEALEHGDWTQRREP